MGMSPEDTVHWIEIVSPASGISSPNVKGIILGGTMKWIRSCVQIILKDYFLYHVIRVVAWKISNGNISIIICSLIKASFPKLTFHNNKLLLIFRDFSFVFETLKFESETTHTHHGYWLCASSAYVL